MTRKDYVAIAEVLQSYRDSIAFTDGEQHKSDAIDAIGGRLADTLEQDNPRFDRERFLKACGI